MSGEPEDLVLRYLRRIDEKVDSLRDDMRDVKQRLTSLEGQVALLHGDYARQSERIDRVELRLERIERRLNLAEA
jgi:predicted  nucleic acid-binding Zn-ribbon protein